MIDCAAMSRAARMVLTLSCFLAAGCAGVKHAQKTEPVPVAPPAASIPVTEAPATTAPEAETAPAAVEAPEARATPVPPPAIQPARPAAPAPAPRAEVAKAPATDPPAVPVAPPKPIPKPPAAIAAAPAAPPPSAAPLDLKSLEMRLRQTKAIGMLTKLSLKNQVDDLLEKFRAYHKRQGTGTLADLRRNYDMLLLKVLSLLQDSDPPLARDIVRSRAAIWSVLEDPRKFTESKLMAGVTP